MRNVVGRLLHGATGITKSGRGKPRQRMRHLLNITAHTLQQKMTVATPGRFHTIG